MQKIIWALGSSVVLMLILTLLRIGLTIKGKFVIVIASFILALGGLSAATTFPLWQTALMLVVLIFFSSYIMDSRMRPLLYKENLFLEEELKQEDEVLVLDNETKDLYKNSNIEMGQLNRSDRLIDYKLENNSNIVLGESNLGLEKSNGSIMDEDFSFLLDHTAESALKEETDLEETELEYLTDIESMLAEEQGELKENQEASWLAELDEFSPTTNEKKPTSSELLTALKEAAAAKEQDEKETI